MRLHRRVSVLGLLDGLGSCGVLCFLDAATLGRVLLLAQGQGYCEASLVRWPLFVGQAVLLG